MTISVDALAGVAEQVGTPTYVYDADMIASRYALLRELFGAHFGVSYAVKANPNVDLMRHMVSDAATFDVSSLSEIDRALAAGCAAEHITFSGPAKRPREIHGAIAHRIGELVLESVAEADLADRAALQAGHRQPVLIRINPATAPRRFGVSFSGRGTQFGVDEEVLEPAIEHIRSLRNLDLIGFHIYSGTNSLDAAAVAANFEIFIGLFRRACAHADIRPRKLVFGSGFGVPYVETDKPLDVEAVASSVMPMIDDLKRDLRFADVQCTLEMGRWLVAPAGWLLTSVVTEKHSRGIEFRACDAGFNNHLAACGMMGTVIRRNWRISNISRPHAPAQTYTLVGPLCTSIDVLASDISLPEVKVGDVLAVANSGAYGLTASPTRFISHPEPAEVIISGGRIVVATEVMEHGLGHWARSDDVGNRGTPALAEV